MAQEATEVQLKQYPANYRMILELGNAGDATVLPEIKRIFTENPELAAQLGDLVQHAEQALLNLVAGSSLTAREAIESQVAELRSRLTATATSDLEKLLIDRVVLSWIGVYHGELDLADQIRKNPTAPATQAAERRLGRAHQRYLTAVKVVATVKKLLQPTLTPLQIATGMQKETRQTKLRPSRSPLLASSGN